MADVGGVDTDVIDGAGEFGITV
jgi:hypothetical protein